MKTKVSPAIVGAFVIGAFALLVIGLLSFGGLNFFSKPQRFVVYFDESIHGLDLGSPVKLRGVRVGRVVDLNILYDKKNNRSVVAVVCELSKNKLADANGALIDVTSRGELQTLVDRGLRAQLGFLGFATGLLFVELDFMDVAQYPAGKIPAGANYVLVPAVPSSLSEFQARATDLLAKLNKIDFAGLTTELTKVLAETRERIAGVDLKGVTEQWKKTGASVDTLVNSPEIKQSFVTLNAALGDLRQVLAKLDTQVDANGAQLTATLTQAKETLESFNAAAAGARKFIAAQSGLGEEATKTLSQLGEAAQAVQRLADFIERNPQSLISGRPDKPALAK